MRKLGDVLLGACALAAAPACDPAIFGNLTWRSVGPARGGRSITSMGSPSRPLVYIGMGKTVSRELSDRLAVQKAKPDAALKDLPSMNQHLASKGLKPLEVTTTESKAPAAL